jgi:hypothetical protein
MRLGGNEMSEAEKNLSALETLRAETHHNLNSSIGLLRSHLRTSPEMDWVERVVIPRLYAVLDAADASLGEKPMREQIADMKREIEEARLP